MAWPSSFVPCVYCPSALKAPVFAGSAWNSISIHRFDGKEGTICGIKYWRRAISHRFYSPCARRSAVARQKPRCGSHLETRKFATSGLGEINRLHGAAKNGKNASDRKYLLPPRAILNRAQLTPSFLCRLVDDVVYWNK